MNWSERRLAVGLTRGSSIKAGWKPALRATGSCEDQLAEIDDFDFLDLRMGDYDFDDPWPKERVRFLAADRQQAGGEHY